MHSSSSESRPRRVAAGCLVALGLLLAGAARAGAQGIPAGVAWLTGHQQADGSWGSNEVRGVHATAEALRALQAVAQAPGNRSAAAGFLETAAVEDSDDRARRIVALAAEGRNTGG